MDKLVNKNFILSAICMLGLLVCTEAKAQYKHAAGVRLGDYSGINFKTFIQPNRALDLIMGFRSNNKYSAARFTGLYEIHNPISVTEGTLSWYYGGGGSVGGKDYKQEDKNQLLLSADGVLGLDYKLSAAPINLSFDWKPALVLSPDTEFDAAQFGLSLRITF